VDSATIRGVVMKNAKLLGLVTLWLVSTAALTPLGAAT
jgi:hypothetical protein